MDRPALTLLRTLPRARLALLFALMFGMALTEGAGIVALVPMLAAMNDGELDLPVWAAPIRALVDLPVLLTFFVALVAGRALLQYGMGLVQLRMQLELVDTWRSRIFAALVRADWRTLSAMRQSDNVSLMVSSIDRIGTGFAYLVQAIATFATLCAIWTAALLLSPLLAMVAIAGGLIVLAGFKRLRRRAHDLGIGLGLRYRDVQATLDDSLRALRLIKSHGREATAIAAMQGTTRDLRDAQVQFQRAAGRARAMLQIGAAVLLAVIVALALRQSISMAVLLPLIALFARSVPLLDTLQQCAQQWAHAAPALGEAQVLLTNARAGAEPPPVDDARLAPRRTIAIDCATVHHAGRAQPALDAVSLSLAVNRTTALLGPSGAGKSTLADLFGGLVTPDVGRVLIDEEALAGESRIRWRHSVAYVHQEPVLFHASIRDNLLWAEPDADDAQLRAALCEASAQFVFDLPQGIDTQVGDAGQQLSGGERQRIALARALLRDPALLILDEATSALDTANETAIANAVAGMRGSRTILIIAHRGMLADIADDVVHLRDGRIERIERHEKVCA